MPSHVKLPPKPYGTWYILLCNTPVTSEPPLHSVSYLSQMISPEKELR